MTTERQVRAHLKKRVNELGGELRKVSWVGRRGAPDELVLLPGYGFFAELKRPGEYPEPHQQREFSLLQDAGFSVFVIDTLEAVDTLFVALNYSHRIGA